MPRRPLRLLVPVLRELDPEDERTVPPREVERLGAGRAAGVERVGAGRAAGVERVGAGRVCVWPERAGDVERVGAWRVCESFERAGADCVLLLGVVLERGVVAGWRVVLEPLFRSEEPRRIDRTTSRAEGCERVVS